MDEEEATEKVVISVTPDSNRHKGGTRRNSTGKANTRDPPSLPNSDEKLLPHYLRASSGSCHDFCKYGRKHVFEVKRRRPFLPTFLCINETPDEENNEAIVSTLRPRRKRPELKLKQPKSELSDGLTTVKQKDLSSATETLSTQAEGSSAERAPVNWDEGSYEEPVVIKQMVSPHSIALYEHTKANRGGGYMEPISVKLDTSSPTQKSIASIEQSPPIWTEGSSEEPVSAKLLTPSCIQKSIIEGSTEKPISMKLKTPSSIHETSASTEHVRIVRAERLSGLSRSKKVKNPSPANKNAESAKRMPAHLSERLSEGSIDAKLKTPFVEKSIASAVRTPANRAEKLSGEQNRMGGLGIDDKKKRQVTKLKTTQRSRDEISDRPKVLKQKEIDVSGRPYLIKRKTPSLVKNTITSIELKYTEQKSPSSVGKTIASPTPKIVKQKASSPSKKVYVSIKPAISLKPKTSLVNSKSPLIPSGGRTVERKQQSRIIRSAGLSETEEEKVMKEPKASLSPTPLVNGISSMKLRTFRSTKPASPFKYQAKVRKGQHDTEIVKEKTLYVIEPKRDSRDRKPIKQKSRKYKSSVPQPSSSSSSSDEDSESAFCETSRLNIKKGKKPVDALKGDSKRRLRKSAIIRSEDKLPSPHKLKFQRGKVVNFQPENNAPRRLKFRQARAAGENQNGKGEVGRQSFKKKEVNGGDLNPPTAEAPAVVLRHQDVQDKKDTQGLFNHMIEETASKLVKSRKSKVMALVGAFETVISLQEGKVL